MYALYLYTMIFMSLRGHFKGTYDCKAHRVPSPMTSSKNRKGSNRVKKIKAQIGRKKAKKHYLQFNRDTAVFIFSPQCHLTVVLKLLLRCTNAKS